MKKIFLTIACLTGIMSAYAQQSWDFKTLGESDKNYIEADGTNWYHEQGEKTDRYHFLSALENAALTAGQTELDYAKGLLFTASAAKTNTGGNIRIDVYSSRLWVAGSTKIVIPDLKAGQKLTVNAKTSAGSSSTDKARGVNATNITPVSGSFNQISEEEVTNVGTVIADGNVELSFTGAMYIYEMSVADADSQEPDEPATITHDVSMCTADNQALLTLNTGDVKYYNTASLTNIHFNNGVVIMNMTDAATGNAVQDLWNGVDQISFVKKASQETPVEIENGQVEITEAKAWLESVYAKWNLFNGANTYNVYVKGGSYTDWTKVDDKLVRNYGTYGRADVVGLAAGTYELKVVAVGSDGEELSTETPSIASGLQVKSYSRQGFAFIGGYSPGAYNSDGTLKANAKVFYVTKKTAKTITTTVVTDTKGGTTECTGLQAIITAYEKGCDTTPIAFRFIGLVEVNDLDEVGSKEEGIQVKGRREDSELNMTFEGIGDDATLRGFGFLVRNAKGVEFRNLGIMRCMDDGISMDTDNSNIWVHHCDMFYGRNGGGDHDKGDGQVDVKSDSKYVTISHNRFWDTGKTNMFGMKSESGPNYISYDHNWFDHSDSRHPRVRTMSVHVWNNYFDNVAKYGVGATSGASIFVENNYFLKTKKPILSSLQGTDGLGSGTFSGENGGMIKAFGNYFDRSAKHFSYYTQHNPSSMGYDAYETDTRDEKVPETEKTLVGGTTYDNFDTDATLMYQYDAEPAADVPATVTGYYGAGRLNHGDFSYTFADNIGDDDADSAYDTVLGGMLDSYESKFVGFFGEEADQGGDNPGGGGTDDPDPEIDPVTDEIFLYFLDKNATPSNNFFTITGNGSTSKGEATIDGQVYTICLKMESATSVEFTIAMPYVMTLYFGDTETASIKINGNKISGSGSTYTEQIEPGSYELTKDKSVNLFGIKLTPVADETSPIKNDPVDL